MLEYVWGLVSILIQSIHFSVDGMFLGQLVGMLLQNFACTKFVSIPYKIIILCYFSDSVSCWQLLQTFKLNCKIYENHIKLHQRRCRWWRSDLLWNCALSPVMFHSPFMIVTFFCRSYIMMMMMKYGHHVLFILWLLLCFCVLPPLLH